jgi:hypothetical protein
MASAQGTILEIKYRGEIFGSGTPSGTNEESSLSKMLYSHGSFKYSIHNHVIFLLKLFVSFVAIYTIGKYVIFKLKMRRRETLLEDYRSEI